MDDSANPNNSANLSNPGDQTVSNPEAISPTPQAISDFSNSQTPTPVDPNTLAPAQPTPMTPPAPSSFTTPTPDSTWSQPQASASEPPSSLNVNPTSPAFNFSSANPAPSPNSPPSNVAPVSALPSFSDSSNPAPAPSDQYNPTTLSPLESYPPQTPPANPTSDFNLQSSTFNQTPPAPTFTTPAQSEAANQSASAFDSAVGTTSTLGSESLPPPPSLEQTEPAPTDLSQLTANAGTAPPTDVYNPSVSSPETLVVPSEPSTVNPTAVSAMPHKKLPLAAIIGAVVVILAVSGASAYFILGIGKSSPPSTPASLPISKQAPLTNPPKQIPTSTPNINQVIQNPATGSSSFGVLNGSASPTPTPTKAASSAADLLKAKQASSSAGH